MNQQQTKMRSGSDEQTTKQCGAWQWMLLASLLLFFVILNLSIYILVTARLSNNYGNAASAKMVDVAAYLPHEQDSKLVRIESSLHFEESEELPVLDGAAALVPVYAAFIDNVYPQGTVTYEGGSFSDDNFYGENFAADSVMQYKNTVRGYKAIVDGDTDVFFSAKPSEQQKEYAKEHGVELVYEPIGREAFVFFVNENNPVNELTTAQIRDIYSGKIKNWKESGGADRPINPVTRLQGSGSQTAMDSFMGELQYGRKSLLAFMGGSIGYSFRYYLNDMIGNSNVKMLALNGVYPDEEHIMDGSYPIVAQFYAIYRADNDNPNVKRLVDWILSEEGQQIIEKTGYVRIR